VTAPATTPATTATPPVASRTTWAVQVAAFQTRAGAQDLVARLGKRGLTAHVSGSAAPYRVRIGRLASRADAVKLQQELAAKKITGFVVSEETPR
jgi:cell division protein FtsN